ncbi:MAG: hypothetical protein COY66_00760 [Candidatus Kerfeldbacteria bacterium CG_4_10_14_0_8_um_filter_42_10]|uniref:SET domain-containing protein-lysine N-methyltransferase n=1 Tax=Candidatus Kerfeldbacteria bacterium CG_4_10_14_0_8_um_filter_42_10 TaxID=2014248 RepID=A0A2M7RKE1_9BACT|nr:MAG: hypothetical protein COY66_00760 [Candidatus Kerfeldbacteria bacterium CG_4_10_14_0_8_um_filter_42_10]
MTNVIVKESKINQQGVFANKDFKKGEIVLRWKPKKILTKEEAAALPEKEKHYISNYQLSEFILQSPPERYVNHSCDPNTEVINNCDIALRDIKKGEEITSDYGKDNVFIHFECNCGSKNCRKFI